MLVTDTDCWDVYPGNSECRHCLYRGRRDPERRPGHGHGDRRDTDGRNSLCTSRAPGYAANGASDANGHNNHRHKQHRCRQSGMKSSKVEHLLAL